MSLNIYTDKRYIPTDMRLVTNNDNYFSLMTIINDSSFVKNVLEKIDKAKRISNTSFFGRSSNANNLPKDYLSTGTKTLLNIQSHPEVCFDVVECGSNALFMLKDLTVGNVLWSDMILFSDGKEYDCDILVDNERHYSEFWSMIQREYDLHK